MTRRFLFYTFFCLFYHGGVVQCVVLFKGGVTSVKSPNSRMARSPTSLPFVGLAVTDESSVHSSGL
jgi:hypothetical protein